MVNGELPGSGIYEILGEISERRKSRVEFQVAQKKK